jgi:hypothetical protein
MKYTVKKVVSGGQTGVDRAAVDVALELGMSCGGWCPKGRKAEDGRIPDQYPLQETPSADYRQRTEWNVRDSDGTVALTFGEPTEGTAQAIRMAENSLSKYQSSAARCLGGRDDTVCEYSFSLSPLPLPETCSATILHRLVYSAL